MSATGAPFRNGSFGRDQNEGERRLVTHLNKSARPKEINSGFNRAGGEPRAQARTHTTDTEREAPSQVSDKDTTLSRTGS